MTKHENMLAAKAGDRIETRLPRFRDLAGGGIEEIEAPRKDAASPRAFGVGNADTLIVRLLSQAADVMDVLAGQGRGANEVNDAAALLEGIDPQDAVEAMLAVQMVTAHNAAMRFMRLASRDGQSPREIESNTNRATKLMRTYTAQVEALNRHRAKARQTMIVKHVHVHDGGQAIVGNVAEREGG